MEKYTIRRISLNLLYKGIISFLIKKEWIRGFIILYGGVELVFNNTFYYHKNGILDIFKKKIIDCFLITYSFRTNSKLSYIVTNS